MDAQGQKPSIHIIEYDNDTLEEHDITDLGELAKHFANRNTTYININPRWENEPQTNADKR